MLQARTEIERVRSHLPDCTVLAKRAISGSCILRDHLQTQGATRGSPCGPRGVLQTPLSLEPPGPQILWDAPPVLLSLDQRCPPCPSRRPNSEQAYCSGVT